MLKQNTIINAALVTSNKETSIIIHIKQNAVFTSKKDGKTQCIEKKKTKEGASMVVNIVLELTLTVKKLTYALLKDPIHKHVNYVVSQSRKAYELIIIGITTNLKMECGFVHTVISSQIEWKKV